MSNAGRPQAYLGALEDRVIEQQSIGHELVVNDIEEWTALAELASEVDRISAIVDSPAEQAHARKLRQLVARLRRHDVIENRRHRAIAGMVVAAE
jgi:hypothetical protein